MACDFCNQFEAALSREIERQLDTELTPNSPRKGTRIAKWRLAQDRLVAFLVVRALGEKLEDK